MNRDDMYPDTVNTRRLRAVPDPPMREPSRFNNIWVELYHERIRTGIMKHNLEVLMRMVRELLEAEPLDADTGHYGRLLALIEKGDEKVDINPKSGGQARGSAECQEHDAETNPTAVHGAGGRHEGGVPSSDGDSSATGGVVHLGETRRSSDEGTGW